MVRPEVVVVLGATAARSLMGPGVRVTRERGQVVRRDGVAYLPTVHPSSVLRTPDADRPAAYDALVADLRVVAGLLADGVAGDDFSTRPASV